MNSKLLKLDAPYNVIYAGGRVGRHVATLMVWNDDAEMAGGITDAASYPVIDEGEEFPAGTLCDFAELHDCRVLCPPGGTNLFWVSKIIRYDFQQLEPAGAEYILDRLKLLGCSVKMPTEKNADGEDVQVLDFRLSLDIMKLTGPVGIDNEGTFRARTPSHQGFYFEAEGTPDEIFNELHYQKMVYLCAFQDELVNIRFHSDDGYLEDMVARLNEVRV